MRRLFKQFSFPGGVPSHVARRDAGLDPRGRRARLRALARVRRGVRQPGPDRRVRDRRRRGGDRAAGRELALEQVPRPGARRRGAADPAPQRLQDRQPDGARAHRAGGAREPARRLRLEAVLRRGPRPGGDAPADGRDARRGARRDRARSRREARASGQRAPAALADDRAAHAEGLDRAEGGRRRSRPRATGARTRCRSPRSRAGPTTCEQLEEWMRSYRPEELFDADGRLVPELRALAPEGDAAHGRQPARQRRHAAARACGCPTSATTRSTSRRRARRSAEATRVLGGFLRDVMRRNLAERNFRLFGPDENASNRLQARLRDDRQDVAGARAARRRGPRGRRARDGDPLRAHLPGLARGLPADRPPRAVLLLRGVHPHRRLDVQPAREVAEDHARAAAGARRSRR